MTTQTATVQHGATPTAVMLPHVAVKPAAAQARQEQAMATTAHTPAAPARGRTLLICVTALMLGGAAGGVAGNALEAWISTPASVGLAP
jgi:hypothetical protein